MDKKTAPKESQKEEKVFVLVQFESMAFKGQTIKKGEAISEKDYKSLSPAVRDAFFLKGSVIAKPLYDRLNPHIRTQFKCHQ